MLSHMGNFEFFKCLKFIGLMGFILPIICISCYKKPKVVTLAPSSENVNYPYDYTCSPTGKTALHWISLEFEN